MNYQRLIALPKEVKQILDKEVKDTSLDSLKKLFDLTKKNGKLKFKYILSQKQKLPAEVWKTKLGDCFDLSLFLLACAKYCGFKAQYCEVNYDDWDHACVSVKIENKELLLDPARDKWNTKYKKVRKLNEKQTLANYYANLAKKIYPNSFNNWKTSKEKAIKFARQALKLDPKSKRAKEIIKGKPGLI